MHPGCTSVQLSTVNDCTFLFRGACTIIEMMRIRIRLHHVQSYFVGLALTFDFVVVNALWRALISRTWEPFLFLEVTHPTWRCVDTLNRFKVAFLKTWTRSHLISVLLREPKCVIYCIFLNAGVSHQISNFTRDRVSLLELPLFAIFLPGTIFVHCSLLHLLSFNADSETTETTETAGRHFVPIQELYR